MIGLISPSGVRVDGYEPRASPVATYVRLEYGDGDAEWFLAGNSTQPIRRGADRVAERRERRRGRRGVVAYLTSLFQSTPPEDDGAAETDPSVRPEAASLAR